MTLRIMVSSYLEKVQVMRHARGHATSARGTTMRRNTHCYTADNYECFPAGTPCPSRLAAQPAPRCKACENLPWIGAAVGQSDRRAVVAAAAMAVARLVAIAVLGLLRLARIAIFAGLRGERIG